MKEAIKTMEITVARTIPASPEQVFDVWLDSTSPGGPWFGAERTILNAVVDGLFYFAFKHEGRIWAHYGRFIRVERPRALEHTWMSEATRGLDSLVSIAFEPRGSETHMTLRHSGLPDDAMGRQHEEGWTWILSSLAEGLAKRGAAKQ